MTGRFGGGDGAAGAAGAAALTTPRPVGTVEVASSGQGARRALLLVASAGVVLMAVEGWHLARTGRSAAAAPALSMALAAIAVAAALSALFAVRRDRAALESVAEELRASEKQAAGITSISVDAIITVDEGQRILLFNHGAETTFGWSAGDVIGQPLSLLLPERYHAAHARHIERFGTGPEVARRMGQRQEIAGRRKDGTEFPAEASISRLDLPGRRLFTVVLRDVTERHRQLSDEHFLAEAGVSLSESLDYESTLVSAVHLAIPHLADCCVLDLVGEDGTIRRIPSVHDDPDRTKRLRELEARGEAPSNWPFPVATVIASRSPVTQQYSAAADPARPALAASLAQLGMERLTSLPLVARGRMVGVLTLICTDAARLFDAERLRVAESVSKLIALAIDNAGLYRTAQHATVARDEVLGAVSHDLRNPLAAITMCARVLTEDASVANRDELLGAIIESAAMMNRMIQDLLDVATIESGHFRVDPSPQRLDDLLERVLEMTRSAAAERLVDVRGDVAASLPDVLVDSTRMIQVLANLIENAVKFTESGGRVSVSAARRADRVEVAVSDNGVGIPADHLPHIFDRHWHSRRSGRTAGTGLGLAIARGIVEAHGGRLRVDSTEGRGSTFSFTIPVAPARADWATPSPP